MPDRRMSPFLMYWRYTPVGQYEWECFCRGTMTKVELSTIYAYMHFRVRLLHVRSKRDHDIIIIWLQSTASCSEMRLI